MPRLSTAGNAISPGGANGTVGVGVISINGSVPAALSGYTGGSWSYKTTNLVVGTASVGGGDFKLYQLNISGASVSTLASVGGNFQAAGGGDWAVYLSGTYLGEGPGVRTSVGGLGPFSAASLADVSEDGHIALITNASLNAGLAVYNSTGTLELSIATQLTNANVNCRVGMLAYQDMQGWHLKSIATGGTYRGWVGRAYVSTVIPFAIGTDIWVLEYQYVDDQFSIRPAKGGSGFLLPQHLIAYGIDVIGLSGAALIAYSTGSGQAADELVTLSVNLTTGTTVESTVVAGSLVPGVGPTLTASSFPGTNDGLNNLPVQSQKVLNEKGEMVKPWRDVLQAVSGAVQSVTTSVANLPAPTVPNGFTTIGGVTAGSSADTLTLTSTDGSVTITPDQPSKTIDFSVVGGYCYIPMTTGAVPGEILFVGSEVMLTKVPVV